MENKDIVAKENSTVAYNAKEFEIPLFVKVEVTGDMLKDYKLFSKALVEEALKQRKE